MSSEEGTASLGTGRGTEPASETVNELQRQVNALRSDLLDEGEKLIGRWQESNGTVLVVLGIRGLWAYAKFRAIAAQAEMGVARPGAPTESAARGCRAGTR